MSNDLLLKIGGSVMTILLGIIAWFMVLTYYNMDAKVDSKLDSKVFAQWITLTETRIATQKLLNVANKEEHEAILDKLEEINRKIHEIQLQYLRESVYRGDSEKAKRKWFHEELICFAWERGITFNRLQ